MIALIAVPSFMLGIVVTLIVVAIAAMHGQGNKED